MTAVITPAHGIAGSASTEAAAGGLPFTIAPPMPHIREYREGDAEELARMWRESAVAWPGADPGREHSTAALVRQEQRDTNTLATFVAVDRASTAGEERIVGYLSLFEYPPDASAAYVGTLSAHPDWHGKGYGRDLLRAALARTVALGYARLNLGTWAGNLKAVPLYKKSGYFWVPETSVHMENYLPLIFRLAAAQRFLQHADWYADFQRELTLVEDDEKLGKLEVYTYRWERGGRRLKAVIDRHAKALVALETDSFAVLTEIDDPRLPIGGRRHVSWRIQNYEPVPLSATIIAEGEDSVRCTLQSSAAVSGGGVHEWAAPVTAEQPQAAPPAGRPANRVRSVVVVEGDPIPLALSARLHQPVAIDLAGPQPWLTPGVGRTAWLTVENSLDEAVRGTLTVSAAEGLEIDRHHFDFALDGRGRASWKVATRAATSGSYPLRAQARVTISPGSNGGGAAELTPMDELATKVVERVLHCGAPGSIFVDRDDAYVHLSTDRLVLRAGLRPAGWGIGFRVSDGESGKTLLSHNCSLGPPFWPSVFTTSYWTPRIEQEAGGVTLVLSTAPPALPGITFERRMRLSTSGLIQVSFRATNAGDVPRPLMVHASTSVDLDVLAPAGEETRVAAPLATGLVVDESMRFPDWREPEFTQPDRYAEQWMAEFGDGWVGATIWQNATAVEAGWDAPGLTLDLGTVAPGGQAETAPLYVYAGQGDWKTARALWRQLVAPDASEASLAPRPAHSVRLEPFVFDTSPATVQAMITSERARPLTGTVSVAAGARVETGAFEGVRAGVPRAVSLPIEVPDEAGAVPATLTLDHQASSERYDAALIRIGRRDVPVAVRAAREGGFETVRVANGRLRFAVVPAQMGRIVELSRSTPDGEWQNQLHASVAEPSTFVWFNPWYGGVHATLQAGGGRYPGRLHRAAFDWHEVERTGTQGIAWRGIALSTVAKAPEVAGLRVDLAYLTAGESNLLAVALRVENQSGARVTGDLELETFLQPGGDRQHVTLYYERRGLRNRKRVHGGAWMTSGRWCAVVPDAADAPTLAVVGGTVDARIHPRDMGTEGVHPYVEFPIVLAPGEATEGVAYLVVADNLQQARLYRFLAGVDGLA